MNGILKVKNLTLWVLNTLLVSSSFALEMVGLSTSSRIRMLNHSSPLPDPDLEIRGEGGGHPNPEITWGGARSQKKNFFGPSGLTLV